MRADTQKTIFIVDPIATNLAVAEKALEKQYQVRTFQSAAEMFAALKTTRPNLILLSIMMMEMDGFEAMKLLKSNKSYADIPTIFLSGSDDIENEVKCFELGAVDFIRKPYHIDVLLCRVRNHLRVDDMIRGAYY